MGPKPSQPQTGELFRPRLDEQINMKHPLVRLAVLIDWAEIERAFAVSFTSGRGRPALPPRLVAGLLYLQHTFDASDEAVVNTWVENPYWQYFCGETYLQTELPIDPSSLTRWRKRVGEEGVETLLAASIDAARRGGVIRKASVQQVIVDTTVMPKAIAHPTDSRLLDKSRQHLVKVAQDNGLQLRQNYNRCAPRLAVQVGRYAHAKQFKRMNKAVRTLRNSGAASVTLVATHGLLSGPAVERLSHCGAHEIVFMDTVPIPEEKRLPNMTVLSCAPLLAAGIRSVFEEGSVAILLDGLPEDMRPRNIYA